MNTVCRILGAFAASVLLVAAPAWADPGEETGFLALGAGYYDFDGGDDDAADFRLDYRHGQGLYFVKPWVGLQATSDGAVWGGGGIYIDIPIYERFYLTGTFGAGGYSDGDGKDLGHTIEFRSQAEATYRFENGMRLGVAISHLSNAGLDDRNPGVNILSAMYILPLSSIIPE